MSTFIVNNLFLSFFVFPLIIVFGLRYLSHTKKANSKGDFLSGKNILISFALASVIGLLSIVTYFIVIFKRANDKSANTYSKIENTIPRILISNTEIFENVGAPNYIGKKIKPTSLNVSDTIFPSANYLDGSLFNGTHYYLVQNADKSYWISENNCLSYIDFAYDTQKLKFSTADEDENKVFWERAKEYTQMYQKYHGSDKPDEFISNDTLIETQYFAYSATKLLSIERKKINSTYEFEVYAPENRGSENTIIKGLSKNGKTIRNAVTCAYYIQHGNFYREK